MDRLLVAIAGAACWTQRSRPRRQRLGAGVLAKGSPSTGPGYPQAAPNDDTNAVGAFLFRDQTTAGPAPWLSVTGVADLRADTHDQTGELDD